MGRVKDECERRWQNYYDEYMDSISPASIGITTVDAAMRYADEMMLEEEEDGEMGK